MLATARIGVLVQRRAIEPGKRPVVARKVRGYPVQDHADPLLVEMVDEVAKVVRSPETSGRCEVPRDLVSPRPAEGVLHDRQQLDMAEARQGAMLCQAMRQLAITENRIVIAPSPGAEMHFVDGQR